MVPSMIDTDPPHHNRHRGIVSADFTPRRVQNHEPFLRRKVAEPIDAVAARGECDFGRDLATPLPMYMIGEPMGGCPRGIATSCSAGPTLSRREATRFVTRSVQRSSSAPTTSCRS